MRGSIHPQPYSNVLRIFLADAALPLLFASGIVVQILVYLTFFGTKLSGDLLYLIITYCIIFALGYLAVAPTTWSTVERRVSAQNDFQWALGVLLALSLAYLVVAALRIYERAEAFRQGAAMARFLLESGRTGMTVTGALNALLMGAPVCLAGLIILRARDLQASAIRWAGGVVFMLFCGMIAAEGARLPTMFGFLYLGGCYAVSLMRGIGLRTIGRGFSFTLLVGFAATILLSIDITVEREAIMGRDAEATARHFGSFLGNEIPDQGFGGFFTRLIADNQTAIVAAFYVSHPLPVISGMLEQGLTRLSYGGAMLGPATPALQGAGIDLPQTADVARHYKAAGLYRGLIGTMLMDFGRVGGAVAMLIWGIVAGFLWRKAFLPTSWADTLVPLSLMICSTAPLFDILGSGGGLSLVIMASLSAALTWLRPRVVRNAEDLARA